MTLSPPGAHIAPVDLPPPPPSSDPREPSPTAPFRSRPGARTPVRHRSPISSRASSPVPPMSHRSSGGNNNNNNSSATPVSPIDTSNNGPPTLYQPTPRSVNNMSPSQSLPLAAHHHLGHHHLSRPSSPSSIHSSSSAIFERDIEVPAVASLSLNPNSQSQGGLNHKPSRMFQPHGSNLDNTVPAVLDDAVEALTSQDNARGVDSLEIEAPASAGGINMARQSSASLANISQGRKVSIGGVGGGIFTSRSPSPISVASRSSGIASPVQSPPIMGQIGTQGLKAETTSPNLSPTGAAPSTSINRPLMGSRISTGPLLPGGWSSGYGSSTNTASTTISAATSTESEASTATSALLGTEENLIPPNPIPTHLSPNKDKRRISFISYNDLLLSVPTTVTPLGEITSGHQSPDHLPGTVSPNVGGGGGGSSRSPLIPSATSVFGSTAGIGEEDRGSLNVIGGGVGGVATAGAGLGFGEQGEWQREGLGRGLEQRLEDLVPKTV